MKGVLSWLLKPWVMSLIGVLLLSLIVWFEGPLVAFNGKEPLASENVRWITIVLLFMLWGIVWLWRFVWAKFTNLRLIRGVAKDAGQAALTPGEQESAAEVAALAERMQEAMRLLRKARLGSGPGTYLYRLPWYMFVGAPGAGKTTLLTQSGLRFPLADELGHHAVGGVGGTRNCDWWFTDEAVLLDTAGRYTTQDSFAEADKGAWEGFLDLLKKHRRRRPINGIIVALSVADLLQQNEAERRAQALAIRERIKELHEHLGIRFPIYVMVTKCDLLAGFIEFFDNLGKEERAQVWGVTFPGVEADQVDKALASFPGEFDALEAQLQARVIDRMQSERDLRRRALIFGFPQQFAAIGEVLSGFLNDVFQSTRYEERALLRGVYFTSGTQEGSPIDRVLGSLASAFGLDRQALPPNATSGRSYFITRLLREVIFPEAELAGTDLRFERRRKLLQWTAVGATAVVSVALSAALATSYVRNKALITDAAQQASELDKLVRVTPPKGSPLATLQMLDAARYLPGGYAGRENAVPWLMRFGLYQGDKLGAGAELAYRRLLRDALLPRILSRMEDQLRRGNANSPEYLYQLLRVYLMLGDVRHFDANAVRAWLAWDWERNLPEANDVQRHALLEHVSVLLESYAGENGSKVALDNDLVADTRLILARMPLPQWIYDRLKRELARMTLTDFNVAAVSGRDALQVLVRRSGEPLTRGVPGMYTLAGYRQFDEQLKQAISDIAQDSWVFAPQESLASTERSEQLKAAVEQLYFDEYIKQWDDLLADVGIVSFTSLDQGARVTSILSGSGSPLRRFLQAAAKETTLEGALAAKSPVETVTNAVKGKLDEYRKKLETALASNADAPAPVVKTANPVDAHFDALHKMVGSGAAGVPAPIDSVMDSLAQAAQYFDAADAARRAGTPPPASDALTRLKREADGKPGVLVGMLQDIDANGAGLTLGTERARLNALWSAAAAPFCRQAIAGRYPLVRDAAQDVTPDDFGRFFGPGGIMDDFFQKNLLPYVNMSGDQWRWRQVGNVSPDLPQDVLNLFQRAARIRDTFFVSGGKQPSMRFELKPLAVDAAVTQFTFDIDGQTLAYTKNKPAAPAAFLLPSGKGVGEVHLEVSTDGAGGMLKTEGAWSWFRMIDKGQIEPTAQGERFKLNFDVQGRKLVFELKASSVINPFKRETIEQFRCMDRL